MINLNDESFDQVGGNSKIFNNGLAGITEDVTVSLSKRKPDEKETLPDYKVIFTDTSGATVNTSFYYIKEATQYKTVDQQIISQGKVLKHLIHAVVGKDAKFPSFNSPKEMLDGCMKLLREGVSAAPGNKFRIFTNYGTTGSPKKYLQPRSWVPFIEHMDVPGADSRLSVGDLDQMARLAPDEKSTGTPSGAASPNATPSGDDW